MLMVSLSYGFDATAHYLSEEHLQFAITAILTLLSILLPPFLLIFYPCKIFNGCLNCCHKRRWHHYTHLLKHFMDVTEMEKWSYWREGFSINVWNLYARSDYSCPCQLSCCRSNRLVAACTSLSILILIVEMDVPPLLYRCTVMIQITSFLE